MMASPLKQPGACSSAICRNDIFPVGRPVVVRILHSGNLAAKPAASIRYFRTVATFPSQGDDSCDRRLKRCLSLRSLAGRLFSQPTRDPAGIVNLGCALRTWSAFGSLLKYPQKSLGSLRVGFVRLLSVAAHRQHRTTGAKEWRTQIKGISNP